MLKDITLGQFFPADTPVHRLDPRTKLLCVILYIVALFSAKSVLTYGIMITVLAVSVLVSRVPFKSLTKGLKPVYFETGNIFRRAKALVPILVPLFISAFRRADELATAMECRCYHGGEGRTALRVLRYKAADWLVLVAFLALTAGIIVLKKLGF